MDLRPKYKCKIIKFLEYNTGENLGDLGLGDKFLDTTKTRFMKENIEKSGFIKIQNSVLQKIQLRKRENTCKSRI